MKRLTLLALAMPAMALPTSFAQAAGPTCLGQEATIVSSDGQAVGTEGDDVIVATGDDSSFAVSGLGGDDLICVSGHLPKDVFGGGPGASGGAGHDTLQVRLSDEADYFQVHDAEDLDISMAGGFDELRIYGAAGVGRIDGGPGRAVLKLLDHQKSIRLDLEDEVMALDGVGEYQVFRFSRVYADAPRVTLDGDRRDNALVAIACKATVRGGRGDDFLVAMHPRDSTCTPRGARLLGLKGDDRLTGTPEDDVLLGGPGDDRASGRQGRDVCVAETEKGCER